jgi:hypothetical protein
LVADPIVEEIRQIREAQAAKYNYDVKAMFAAARKRQRRSGRKVISLAPKKRQKLGL